MTDDNTTETAADGSNEGRIVEREGEDGMWYEPPDARRRDVAKWLGGIAGTVSVGTFALPALQGLAGAGNASGASSEIYTQGTQLVEQNGNEITVDSLQQGSAPEEHILALPQENGNPVKEKEATTLLLRYNQNDFEEPTNIDGTAQGYVAYSMVCTHAGCLVENHLNGYPQCPCHGSEYDATAGAQVVAGPAPRPIPQLPIAVSKQGNVLVATGDFEGPVGTA